MNLRIGLGIDLHRLGPGQACRLGGIEIPSPVGPVGHSDGDAVLHAICDACLGAAGMDDLGSLFPDDAEENRGRSSDEFCREVKSRLDSAGLRVQSLDVVVEAEQPKLRPHRQAMREHIAELLGLPVEQVNIKGKTGEGLGEIGRGEAIRATAIALLG
ncbi:MAG: 2-C-methyl-D-erythritol 2,4-cyclodiphosphate synthase [Planctomycetota bacterium]|jgi:2-C-methyl-D-erythritol 2,4-cyclodiphosphate synthase